MQFENTTWFYFLLAIPAMVLLFYVYLIWRRRSIRRLGDPALVEQLMDRYSVYRRIWKLVCLLLALSFFTIGLANLRSGSKKEIAKGESSEVLICFDVSNSMLAEDVKPDRLTQAKITASQVIEKLSGNYIGLIVFAGNSYVQMPLTNDARAAMMYLNILNTGMVPTQGTNIGDAISTAIQEFEEGGSGDNKGKAIIFITDGETHDSDATEMADEAGKKGIRIYTIGVGTKNGGPIPVKRGAVTQSFKKDKEGNIILSRLNERMLAEIADETGGFYMNAANGRQVLQKIGEAVDKLDKSESEAFEYAEYANHFQVFLAFGLLFLLLEFFLSDKKPLWLEKMNLFKSKSTAAK